MDEKAKITKPSPYDKSNFLSKIFFLWTLPYLFIGRKRELEFNDFYQIPSDIESRKVTEIFEKLWQEEIKKSSYQKKKPSLLKTLFRSEIWECLKYATVLMIVVCFILSESINVIGPFLLSIVVRYFKLNTDVDSNTASLAATFLCLSLFIFTILRNKLFYFAIKQGVRIRTVLTALLYRKILFLKGSTTDTDIGQILTIVSNDLTRIDELMWGINFLVVGPIEAIIVAIVLAYYLGVACIGGIVALLLLIPLQIINARLSNDLRFKTAILTDLRVKLMEEIISAIKIIKFCCWENAFAGFVARERKREMEKIQLTAIVKAFNMATYASAVRVMLFACLVTHVLLGRKLNAEIVFVSLALFNALRAPVTYHVVNTITLLFETLIGIKRTESILLLNEKPNVNDESYNLSKLIPKGSISLNHLTAKFDINSPKINLKSISLNIDPGQLIVVIGSVGSGKSCLLMAILQEIHTLSGTCTIHGKISYCSQEPWTFRGTVRENIIFGSTFDEVKYNKVLNVCCLRKDLTLFPFGDSTLIGEKGYTLSGGQKARIGLARAIYADADIYLLDDPLSAVDPAVGKNLFYKCVQGYLNHCTRILITHQLQFLEKADKILVLKDGECVAFGNLQQLINSEIDFGSFLKSSNVESKSSMTSMSLKPLTNKSSNLSIVSNKKSLEVTPTLSNEDVIYNNTSDPSAFLKQLESKTEVIMKGSLKKKVYIKYFTSGSSLMLIFFTLLLLVLSQFFLNFTDYWLATWSDFSGDQKRNVSSVVRDNLISSEQIYNVYIYTFLVCCMFVLTMLRLFLNFRICVNSSINLHNSIFKKLLCAPIAFFENNPSGRILNRFTRDIGIVDSTIPNSLVFINLNIVQAIGVFVLSIIVVPLSIIPIFFLMVVIIYFRKLFLRTVRNIVRQEAATRSPIYNAIATTFEGITTIRTHKIQDTFMSTFYSYLNDNNSCKCMFIDTGRIIALILDGSAVALFTIITIICMVNHENFNGGQVGLILTTISLIVSSLQYSIRLTAEFETNMISVERILEYDNLPSEKTKQVKYESINLAQWPSLGSIEFLNVYLTYPNSELPVLYDLTFTIKGGEKIGIVGRTGAGKSSIISILFRLFEFDGIVRIDGIDIKQLNLDDLRKKISIIPQDPLLFRGTIRTNLDPFNNHTDEDIWKILESLNIKSMFSSMPGGLNAELGPCGSNLSHGQRQLLCLVRALLQRNKIMILDEATANVDVETDMIIQKSIRDQFKDCTVLTVAHRLNTIIDYDRIIVLEDGHMMEFDEPYNLLKQKSGLFYNMLSTNNEQYQQTLFDLAFQSYKRKHSISNSNT